MKIPMQRATALALAIVAWLAALFGYYSAADVDAFLQSDDTVTVSEIREGRLFDGPGERDALIFYPGAKVEAAAYAPLLRKLAENGVDCFLVEMPLGLAIFGVNKADRLLKRYDYDRWYLAGHSLGGAMAAQYAAKHADALSGLFLLGVVLLYNVTGHLLMPDLRLSVSELWANGRYTLPITAAICLITVGIAVKSGLFPFHFWMPDTYGYATPSSSGILSGLISKGYIFFLIKIIFDVFGTNVFYESGVHNVLFAFGAMGIVVGSVSAMRENDIFRMIAYSSAAQIGYIYLGIGISPEAGILAALFHILTHAVTKPPLFLAAARLCDVAGGKKRFADLQGAAWSNHLAGAAFTAGAFSMIGLPLTMGFISKYLFALSAFRANIKMVPTLIILALSTVLNTLYFARTVLRIYGHPSGTPAGVMPVRKQRSYAAAAILFAVFNFAAGVAASPLIDILERGLAMF